MSSKVGFDPETLAILEGILDEAWVSPRPRVTPSALR
jgi:hypothetical protein